MSFSHYVTDDNGESVRPDITGWDLWVAASGTRNWCLHNTLQDWLSFWGDRSGFQRDPEPDPRTDWQSFIFAKGHEFEAAVMRLLGQRTEVHLITGIENPTRALAACEQTFEAMSRAVPIVAQGVLWNPASRTYGSPDLLVRSDILRSIFPDAVSEEHVGVPAPGIGLADRHYRVIDIKFTTLRLDRHWNASYEHLPYLAQVFVYNEALGRIQGYRPDTSYLLGRSWSGPGGEEGTGCFDRLAPVPHAEVWKRGAVADIVNDAVGWVRRVRADGAGWHPLLGPSIAELRPNPGAADYPWQAATKEIAERSADPILAWQVGCAGRELARDAGVSMWTDPRFCAELVGLTGVRAATLDTILEMNRDHAGPDVSPPRIAAEREAWINPGEVEFFVDFETVSDVKDDFSRLPLRAGQAMIFMIGCGHIEAGEWRFDSFVAERLELASEATVIEEWLAHMDGVRQRLAPNLAEPVVFHWSPAESSGLTSGMKSARMRHPERSKVWAEPNWFDFLGGVVRAEPVVVRGPMGLGLKTFARSLRQLRLIKTDWETSVTDGLGAMVGAWTAYREAADGALVLTEMTLMQDIRRYNEVDCKVMMETIDYLRQHH